MSYQDFSLSADPLSFFFLAVILLVSVPSAVYAFGYWKSEYSPRKTLGGHLLFILFMAAMALVVTVRHTLAFLVAWELMSLISYGLVIFDSSHERSVRSGTIYIVMTHGGTAFLTAAFFLLHHYTASFDFASIRQAASTIPPGARNLLFLLFFVGFGTKAGVVPFHIWLPYAHPQAPSHVSSVMSGVMITTAVYGLLRFVVSILGTPCAWWGVLILAFAALSCVAGILYALMERDLKRLLAYSSIEHIGIILLGVGLSILLMSLGQTYIAVASLAAALYHLLNHAIFKGLLFLGAGAVYKAAGTRDMEKLGGLIRRMPQTAFFFLIGALAISALPPLNGFVSEWLTFKALFAAALKVGGGLKLYLGIMVAVLALTGGLAAACFVKAFGITFLARPRTRYAGTAVEAPLSMRLPMAFLALSTLLLGLAAVPLFKVLACVAGASTGIDTAGMVFSVGVSGLGFAGEEGARLSMPLIALALLGAGATGYAAYRLFPHRPVRFYRTWDCGYYSLTPRNEYTATAFSKPFRIAFNFLLLPYRKTQKIRDSFYHVKAFRYETHTTKVFNKYVYDLALAGVFTMAKAMRRLQTGSIHLYLAYIFATVLVLLVFIQRF